MFTISLPVGCCCFFFFASNELFKSMAHFSPLSPRLLHKRDFMPLEFLKEMTAATLLLALGLFMIVFPPKAS